MQGVQARTFLQKGFRMLRIAEVWQAIAEVRNVFVAKGSAGVKLKAATAQTVKGAGDKKKGLLDGVRLK